MTMRSDLQQLSEESRALCYAIEKLPSSEQQTKVSVLASALASNIRQVSENMIAATYLGEESPNESVVCGACGTEFITAKIHGECPGCKSNLKAAGTEVLFLGGQVKVNAKGRHLVPVPPPSTGRVPVSRPLPPGTEVSDERVGRDVEQVCPECEGRGYWDAKWQHSCQSCLGTGRVPVSRPADPVP